MARRVATLAALLLAALAVFGGAHAAEVQDSDEYADSYAAHLVVHKAVQEKEGDLAYPLVVQGRNATVVITLHNTGTG